MSGCWPQSAGAAQLGRELRLWSLRPLAVTRPVDQWTSGSADSDQWPVSVSEWPTVTVTARRSAVRQTVGPSPQPAARAELSQRAASHRQPTSGGSRLPMPGQPLLSQHTKSQRSRSRSRKTNAPRSHDRRDSRGGDWDTGTPTLPVTAPADRRTHADTAGCALVLHPSL